MTSYEEVQQFLKFLVSFEWNNSKSYYVKCIITLFLITKIQTRCCYFAAEFRCVLLAGLPDKI